MGYDPLEHYMKHLSREIPLSTDEYTNHSIRHTVIQMLDEGGVETRHLMTVSGHKSEMTIHQYSKKCPKKKIREMADLLAEPLKKSKGLRPSLTLTSKTHHLWLKRQTM